MRRLKEAFDPDNILNPGVIINDNPNVYVEALKPMLAEYLYLGEQTCTYTIKAKIDPSIRLYEPAEFVHDFLRDTLTFTRLPETITVHVTCGSTKMGLAAKWRTVANLVAEKTVFPRDVTCCGFAGDRGFLVPELNESALSGLKPELYDCATGVSNARTCEIGLSLHGGIAYQSIMYLIDRCSSPQQ